MTDNNFMWAQGQDANLMEPLKELAENGWRRRDIPKASNMNWIFKQISDDLTTLRKDLEVQTKELHGQLAEQTLSLQEQKETINALKNELGALTEQHTKLKALTKIGFNKFFRAITFNDGISRQICIMLGSLVTTIRAYHPNFPEFTWPLRDEVAPRAGDEVVD